MAEPPHDPARDLEFVRAALTGDPAAVAALWSRLQPMTRRMLAGLNANLGRPLGEHDLEDVAQDTFRTLLRKLPEYVGLGVLEAWVFQICRFELMNAIRGHRRRRSDGMLDDSTRDEAAERAWRQMLDREALERAIDRVGGVEAAALRMKHFEGLSFDQMTARQAISVTAMKARYYRAMKRLMELLEEPGDADGLH